MRTVRLLMLLLLLPCLAMAADFKTALLDAQDAQEEGDYTAAWNIYLRILNDPGSAVAYPTVWYNVGSLLERGAGVKQDLAQAYKYYTMAAERGVDHAHNKLGLKAEAEKRWPDALHHYLRSCEFGHPVAYNNAGRLLMSHWAGMEDRSWGWAMLSLAADARNKEAKKNLAIYEPTMKPEELTRGRLIKALMMKCVQPGVAR